MKKSFVIEYFDVVPFMKQKQRRKKRKERDKNKEAKENKKERQEGRKEGCPFLGGKQGFFLLYKAKKGKEQKLTKKNKK